MGQNGSTTNRDDLLETPDDKAIISPKGTNVGLAQFRVLARLMLNAGTGEKRDRTRKSRLFLKALDAIEKGCENGERWAVREALALTIGDVKTFVADNVMPGEGAEGFEMVITETRTRRIKGGLVQEH